MTDRNVTLAGQIYPLGRTTVRLIGELVPQLHAALNTETVPGRQAQASAIYSAIRNGGFAETFEKFGSLENVTSAEMDLAQIEIGRWLGFYKEAAAPVAPAAALPA